MSTREGRRAAHVPVRAAVRLAAVAVGVAVAVGSLLAGPRAARALDGTGAGLSPVARALEGNPTRIALRDPVVYLGLDSGLVLFDVSNARSPRRLGGVYLPGAVRDFTLVGPYAFLACGEAGLQIVDVGDPEKPWILASVPTLEARAVAVDGLAYIAEGDAASGYDLRLVDFSTGAAVTLSTVALPAPPSDLVLLGGIALVALASPGGAGLNGLLAVDVSDPLAPQVLPTSLLSLPRPVSELAVVGGTAYLATGLPSRGALVIADVSSPAAPVVLSSTSLPDRASGVFVEGTRAYVAAGSLGLLTLDVSDRAAPRLLDALPTSRDTIGVVARQGAAFLAERSSIGSASLTAADVADPSAGRIVATSGFAEATQVTIAGGTLLGLRRDGLYLLVNESGDLWPTLLWQPVGADLVALDVEAGLAAVADSAAVHLLDLTDPLRPIGLGDAVVCDGVVVRVRLRAPYLYVVTGRELEVFDVSSPTSPALLGSFPTPGWASAVDLDGPIAYLVAGDTLHVLDVSAPGAPTAIGSLRIAGESLFGVSVRPPLLVMSGLVNLVYTLDVTTPGSPAPLGVGPPGTGLDVRFSSVGHAVVAAGASGVQVVDVSDPALPRVSGFYDTSGEASALAVDGTTLLVATAASQIWMFDCPACVELCSPTWPAVQANSLRVSRFPIEPTLSWAPGPPAGEVNVHRTTDRRAVGTLALDGATVVGTSSGASYADTSAPPTVRVLYYQVFGRDSCTGASHAP